MNEKELQHQADLEKIANFRLLDDDFMSKVFDGSNEETQLVLRIILNDDNIEVLSVQAQYEIKNLQGRSVRLDILAKDMTGRLFNCEIQRADKGAGATRARYNSSLLDTHALRTGANHNELPETYVIFITEKDHLKGCLPIYHIERVIKETGNDFNDGEHIIYVNGAYEGEDDLGFLMSDFRSKDPEKMHYPLLADRTRHFKKSEEGVMTMCRMMEEMRNESEKKGVQRGWQAATEQFVLNCHQIGMTPDQTAKACNISVKEVLEIQAKGHGILQPT